MSLQQVDDLGVTDAGAPVAPTLKDDTMITYQLVVGPGTTKFARLLISQNP